MKVQQNPNIRNYSSIKDDLEGNLFPKNVMLRTRDHLMVFHGNDWFII